RQMAPAYSPCALAEWRDLVRWRSAFPSWRAGSRRPTSLMLHQDSGQSEQPQFQPWQKELQPEHQLQPTHQWQPHEVATSARDLHHVALAPCRSVLQVPHRLLPLMRFDCLLDLLLDCIQVEARRILHGRKVDCRLRQVPNSLLHHHKPPELTRVKVISIAKRAIERRL